MPQQPRVPQGPANFTGPVSMQRGLRTRGVTYESNSISASTDALDVGGVSVVYVTTSGGSVTIGGLANGSAGQIVRIVKITQANDMIIENNEGTGTQKMLLSGAVDKTFSNYGGVELVWNGSFWFEVSD